MSPKHRFFRVAPPAAFAHELSLRRDTPELAAIRGSAAPGTQEGRTQHPNGPYAAIAVVRASRAVGNRSTHRSGPLPLPPPQRLRE